MGNSPSVLINKGDIYKMFKYSHRFLENLAKEPIDYKDFDKNWLDLQGFEVASEVPVDDDTIIELEVKANRPDMLSHLGVLREYYCYKGYNRLPHFQTSIDLQNLQKMHLPVEITTDKVGNLTLLCIKNIDNTKPTPENIVRLLNNLGVASVNPCVDFSNFIMLELGQPVHIYDLDKIKGRLVFKESNGEKITTLNGSEIDIPKGSLVISDDEGVACVAGMIGTKRVEVDENTKNIVIECANFDPVKIRVTSQKTHISTLASYRYERGVDSNMTNLSACLCAEYIVANCGGEIDSAFVKFKPSEQNIKTLTNDYVNKILGTNFTVQEIADILTNYYYKIEILDDHTFRAFVPSYRLDIEQNIDVVGDIAQMYGYHNIEPTMPNLSVPYQPNDYIINSDILRNLMYSQNISECISYSFIHENAMKMLNIDENSEFYGDIKLLNPLSNKFAIMRPNMLYSMISTLAYNVSKEGECQPIFDIGSVFKVDNTTDTGYAQSSRLAVALCGNKIEKGFGILNNLSYDFYDIKQILELIASEYSMELTLKQLESPIFEIGAKILFEGKEIGFIGTINSNILRNFENGKLIKDKLQYLELDIASLKMGVTPLENPSKFPSIEREYNILVKDGVQYADIKDVILNTSPFVKSIDLIDIYKGKGVKNGFVSLLLKIEYNNPEDTLASQDVESIESSWLLEVREKYDVRLKDEIPMSQVIDGNLADFN